MKTLQTLLIGLSVFSVVATSCRKEPRENLYDPVAAMHEIYSGKQGEGTEQPNHYFQLDLEDNGSLLAAGSNDSLPGPGHWEMDGNGFSAAFRKTSNNLQVKLQGVYDPASNCIKGTWGYGDISIGGGSFVVEKVKNITAKKTGGSAVGRLLDRFF